jgi:hypothetical protein
LTMGARSVACAEGSAGNAHQPNLDARTRPDALLDTATYRAVVGKENIGVVEDRSGSRPQWMDL